MSQQNVLGFNLFIDEGEIERIKIHGISISYSERIKIVVTFQPGIDLTEFRTGDTILIISKHADAINDLWHNITIHAFITEIGNGYFICSAYE